jgi:hypothetical protein
VAEPAHDPEAWKSLLNGLKEGGYRTLPRRRLHGTDDDKVAQEKAIAESFFTVHLLGKDWHLSSARRQLEMALGFGKHAVVWAAPDVCDAEQVGILASGVGVNVADVVTIVDGPSWKVIPKITKMAQERAMGEDRAV